MIIIIIIYITFRISLYVYILSVEMPSLIPTLYPFLLVWMTHILKVDRMLLLLIENYHHHYAHSLYPLFHVYHQFQPYPNQWVFSTVSSYLCGFIKDLLLVYFTTIIISTHIKYMDCCTEQ